MHLRVEQWQNPWPTASNPGNSQLAQAWFSMGTGGVGGTGLGFDHFAGQIPELTSDMIFAAIGTEMGLVGCAAVVTAFVLLVGAGFRVAQTARSDFSRLMATGLTLIVGFQAFFIMAGVVRLLPFTGVTLPFVAYGGSSLLANYILIALDAAHLRRGRPGAGGHDRRRGGRRPGRASDGPGTLRSGRREVRGTDPTRRATRPTGSRVAQVLHFGEQRTLGRARPRQAPAAAAQDEGDADGQDGAGERARRCRPSSW